MDCEQAHQQIPAYRAGTLDTADRRALECHLSGCPECAAVFAGADAPLAAAEPVSAARIEPASPEEVH